jgi:DHA1 family inner membrane transport protein
VLTFGGSAAFVFAGAIGRDHVGFAPETMSFVFAANALAGVPSARYRGSRRLTGLWMGVTGLCAIAVGAFTVVPVFVVAMVAWGFSFWMGVPGAFSLLAERSAFPDERAGDAQAVMAAGRVVGPLVGGALYEVSPLVLGLCAGGVMVAASIALLYVEWRIRPSSMPSGLLTRRA